MKRAIIIGATSGIGEEVAKGLLKEGWILGIAGRREDKLKKFQAMAPDRVSIQVMDVTQENAPELLMQLVQQTGGMDLYLHSSGIGKQNQELNAEIEITTFQTNVTGFGRMVITAFQYFREQRYGHLAIISSIAGTKGIGVAPAYSATKRFQNTYMESLSQLANMEKLDICLTDIRPGFVETAFLNDSANYPMLMKPEQVAGYILKALKRRKKVVIMDWRYRILVFFWRMIPHWLWVRLNIRTN